MDLFAKEEILAVTPAEALDKLETYIILYHSGIVLERK